MTTIDRARFISDLSTRQIPVRDLEPSLTGVGSVEIDALSGGDHVFNKPEELGALYDKLVAFENIQRAQGVSGNLDRAAAVYARFAPSNAPAAPIADPSARPRTTGVTAPPSPALVPTTPITAAGYVRTFGRMNAEQLRAAAEKNIMSPEAGARTRILSESARVEGRVRVLEERAKMLPEGSAERANVERDINREVTQFENMVAQERSYVIKAKSGGSVDAMSMVKKALPPYLRESVERGGIVIPGVPGAFKPDTSPPGVGWGLKF